MTNRLSQSPQIKIPWYEMVIEALIWLVIVSFAGWGLIVFVAQILEKHK